MLGGFVAPMSEHLAQAQYYHNSIHTVLMEYWDPIGVRGIEQAEDEYDSYISEIHGLLIRQEPRFKLIDFLWWVETEHMCLSGNRSRTEDVGRVRLFINGISA